MSVTTFEWFSIHTYLLILVRFIIGHTKVFNLFVGTSSHTPIIPSASEYDLMVCSLTCWCQDCWPSQSVWLFFHLIWFLAQNLSIRHLTEVTRKWDRWLTVSFRTCFTKELFHLWHIPIHTHNHKHIHLPHRYIFTHSSEHISLFNIIRCQLNQTRYATFLWTSNSNLPENEESKSTPLTYLLGRYQDHQSHLEYLSMSAGRLDPSTSTSSSRFRTVKTLPDFIIRSAPRPEDDEEDTQRMMLNEMRSIKHQNRALEAQNQNFQNQNKLLPDWSDAEKDWAIGIEISSLARMRKRCLGFNWKCMDQTNYSMHILMNNL